MKYIPNCKEFAETFFCKIVEHKKSVRNRGQISKTCYRLGQIWYAKNVILQSWLTWPTTGLFDMAENWWRICKNFLLQSFRVQKSGPTIWKSFWNQLCVRRNFCCKTNLKFLAACHCLHRRAPMVHNSPSCSDTTWRSMHVEARMTHTHTHTHTRRSTHTIEGLASSLYSHQGQYTWT